MFDVGGSGPGRILVVDDTPANRYTVRRILERAGFTVCEAATGGEGLARAQAELPDLIVLDVKLPDMLGFEVSRRLRQEPETAAIPILQLTASYTSDEDRVRGLERGADSYLTSPVDPQVLVATVRALLRIRDAEQRERRAHAEAQASARRLELLAEEQRRLLDERQRLVEELSRAVKSRDDIIAIASHDLRNPLSTATLRVQAMLQLVRRSGDMPAEALRERLESAEQALARSARLLDVLLDVSQITAGKLHLDRERFDLRDLAREVGERFREPLRQTGAALDLVADAPVVGSWDRVRLDQVATNLMSNAVRYGAGRPVILSVDSDGHRARLKVRDHGPGIAPAERARIFKRFERLEGERREGSFGLGLWIVRSIVAAHGGSVSVDCPPDGGALFQVELPLDIAA